MKRIRFGVGPFIAAGAASTILTFGASAQNGLPAFLPGPPDSQAFGACVESGVDVDGDHYDDVFVIDPEWINVAEEAVGRLYMYSGRTGDLIWAVDGDQEGVMQILSVGTFIHDMDDDLVPDILIGHPFFRTGDNREAGRFEFRSGRTGSLIKRVDGNEQTLHLGRDVIGIEDVNDDDVADVAVVTRWEQDGGDGEFALLSGTDGEVIRRIAHQNPRRIRPIGDLNGDDVGDILVSDFQEQGPQRMVRAYSGSTGEVIHDIFADDDLYGYVLHAIPDVTGDDVDEMVFSVWRELDVKSGRTGHRLAWIPMRGINDTLRFIQIMIGDIAGDSGTDLIVWYGYSFNVLDLRIGNLVRTDATLNLQGVISTNEAAIGDVNGDGKDDLMYGSPYDQGIYVTPGAVLSLRLEHRRSVDERFPVYFLVEQGRWNATHRLLHGAKPNKTVRIFYSRTGHKCTKIPRYNFCLDLSKPIFRLASIQADSKGYAEIELNQDALNSAPPGEYWFQALEFNHGALGTVKSQTMQTEIEE